MTREKIIEKWQNEIAQAESKLEASSLKYQMNLELEAYERGEENRAIKKEKKEIANNLMNYISEMVTNDDLLTSDMLRRLEEKTSNLIKYDF